MTLGLFQGGGCVVALLDKVHHLAQAVAKFLEEYAASTDYANTHAAETAALVEKMGIVSAAVAEKALPGCNLVCITGKEMKTAVNGYLQTLYDLKSESVGGAMPTDGFYWLGA